MSQEQYKACVVIQRIQEYRGTFTRESNALNELKDGWEERGREEGRE